MGKLTALKDKSPLVKDIRGRGLMIGVEFNQQEGFLSKTAIGKLSAEFTGSLIAGELQNRYHIITAYTLNNPNVIRLEPPLIVTEEQMDKAVDALDEILTGQKSFLGVAKANTGTILGSFFKK